MVDIPQPILITGAARSGCSMVAGIINLCGSFVGTVDRDPLHKGMFENLKIKEYLIDPYLTDTLHVDSRGQYPLPDVKNLSIPVDWRQRVDRIMWEDGYRGGSWIYKSSRSCLIWPVWDYAYPRAKWIIVRRRTGDIVHSCQLTDYMDAFQMEVVQKAIDVSNDISGWKWWVHQHEKRFVEMIMKGLSCFVIWPERMVDGNYEQAYELLDWLGLKWHSDVLTEIFNYIDPKLWKVRRK
jgi:hypothetical protein